MARTHDQIIADAEEAATAIDESLATNVVSAEELQEDYTPDRPLEIGVPWLGALVSGQLGAMFYARTWDTRRGLVVQRGAVRGSDPDGKPLGDRETMTNAQLVQVGRPDIDYVWVVDWIRAVQQILNFSLRLFSFLGFQPMPVMDRWGSMFYKARGGGETLFLEIVDHPAYTAALLAQYAATLHVGDAAQQNLVARADRRQQLKGDRR